MKYVTNKETGERYCLHCSSYNCICLPESTEYVDFSEEFSTRLEIKEHSDLPGNKVIVGVVCPTKGDFKKWCSEVGEKSYRNAKFIHIYKVKHVNYRRFYAIEGGYNFENVDPVVFQKACYRIT